MHCSLVLSQMARLFGVPRIVSSAAYFFVCRASLTLVFV
jgi:hypothetical protein